ncbi:HET-domain-containing protein [Polyporus arcularius HHB13444]|uniref:HET-domain-containing protein n=1 Tax=Polyporus arcularius HHB13444 TaxID=1314778 RepID=A0A5C3NYE4_9APHY|nr:HET-domain-containing protein [Polyporus arcularius HHB13444]
MWLLRTDRAELRYFARPPPKYAILSHVWGAQEQSFQDLQAIHSPSGLLDDNPRLRASAKIRGCCVYAESQGFEWVWIDTCCIDKTSSAELSEAINSMYHWYAAATVCYAYLEDVTAEDENAPDTQVWKSKWFTRGWTLQELLASRDVHFLASQWRYLGSKEVLATLLEQITGIDVDVLTFARPITSVPVYKRMSWASRRETTRVEDEAYSLMGMFDVNMPTIYGEGRRAFRRLQEEIMKNSPDHSLFAWGPSISFPGQLLWEVPSDSSAHRRRSVHYGNLLANSPADFAASPGLATIPGELLEDILQRWEPEPVASARPLVRSTALAFRSRRTATRQDDVPMSALQVPEFTVTSLGIRTHLPVIEGDNMSIAILACRRRPSGALLGLVLQSESKNSPLHRVGCVLSIEPGAFKLVNRDQGHFARWIWFDPRDSKTRRLLGLSRDAPTYRWKDVYVKQQSAMVLADRSHYQREQSPDGSLSRRQAQEAAYELFTFDYCAIRFCTYAFAELEAQGLTPTSRLRSQTRHHIWPKEYYSALELWPHRTTTFALAKDSTKEMLWIHVGQCLTWDTRRTRTWLTVEFVSVAGGGQCVEPQHACHVRLTCQRTHVVDWERIERPHAADLPIDMKRELHARIRSNATVYFRAFSGTVMGTLDVYIIEQSLDEMRTMTWIYPHLRTEDSAERPPVRPSSSLESLVFASPYRYARPHGEVDELGVLTRGVQLQLGDVGVIGVSEEDEEGFAYPAIRDKGNGRASNYDDYGSQIPPVRAGADSTASSSASVGSIGSLVSKPRSAFSVPWARSESQSGYPWSKRSSCFGSAAKLPRGHERAATAPGAPAEKDVKTEKEKERRSRTGTIGRMWRQVVPSVSTRR